ncbi:MAG: histidine triad nucleotide-binding protein [Candidatus Omnitrophota bacterium]
MKADKECVFCKIVNKEIPAEIVYEDKDCIGFRDINAQAPEHILVIPKRHIAMLSDLDDSHAELAGKLYLAVIKTAKLLNLSDGFRMVGNCGEDAGQLVRHIHIHLLGGRRMSWPPG